MDSKDRFPAKAGRAPAASISVLLSLAVLVVLWAAVAHLAQSRVLPSPLAVAEFLLAEARTGELFYHLGITLGRVAAAFVLAIVLGTTIGIALGRDQNLNRFFDPWLVLFLNIPALVVIVLAYVWFGLNEMAAVGAVAVNKIPNVAVTLREGTRALNPAFSDLASVYRFSRMQTLSDVILPQLQPYLMAASRSGIALIWKIVLVVELLGRSNGVGFQIHLYFQLFDVAAVLGYALAFVAVMLVVEIALVQPLERRATRWRPRNA